MGPSALSISICKGRADFTRNGEIVWEYVNPYFGGSPLAETNAVFRALRYSAEEIARAEATARA
jgi:hypothetical protein